MVKLFRHRQPKGADTVKPHLSPTAPHLDFTDFCRSASGQGTRIPDFRSRQGLAEGDWRVSGDRDAGADIHLRGTW